MVEEDVQYEQGDENQCAKFVDNSGGKIISERYTKAGALL